MSVKTIRVIEGKVVRDKFGSWDDCDPGLYIDDTLIESIFNVDLGKTIRITIEEIPEREKD